jgi:excinuclease ABC subunit B
LKYYQPAGDQPAAIAGTRWTRSSGLAHQTLLGVTGSGKTFTMANVIAAVQRPTLVIAHNKTLAAQLYGEFKEFFPGQPQSSISFPITTTTSPKPMCPRRILTSRRTRRSTSISSRCGCPRPRRCSSGAIAIIVATVSSIYGLGDPEAYLAMVLHLSRGDRMDQRELLRRLAEHAVHAQRHGSDVNGTYRVRGDVIDIFPAESEREAVRVSCSMTRSRASRYFDPLTGEVLRQCAAPHDLIPKTHYVTPRERLISRRSTRSSRTWRTRWRTPARRTSWSRPSAWSSAPCTTWK